MHYSFSSVLMALISTNLLIIIITLCFRNKKLMLSIGYRVLAIFMVFTFLRFLFPVAFPFTQNIVLPHFLSKAVVFLRHHFFVSGTFYLSIWRILEFVWIAGFLILFCREIVQAIRFQRFVAQTGTVITEAEPYHTILESIGNLKHKKVSFEVIQMENLQTPQLFGIVHPKILLPVNLELTERELYYVLCHESSHHFHHDILRKFCINLLCIFYWWNPACHLLKAQLDTVFEMRVDYSLVGNNPDRILEYSQCLLTIAENIISNKDKHNSPFSASLLGISNSNLTPRFLVMTSFDKKHSRILHITLFIITAAICILSYSFILEARYDVTSELVGTIDSSYNTTYAILNDDSTYDIYFTGYYVETTASLEYYPADILIFDSIDDVLEELKTINLDEFIVE